MSGSAIIEFTEYAVSKDSLLATIRCLPSDAMLVRVFQNDGRQGRFSMIFESEHFDELAEGELIPRLVMILTKTNAGDYTGEWQYVDRV